jgi:hypothetical protein
MLPRVLNRYGSARFREGRKETLGELREHFAAFAVKSFVRIPPWLGWFTPR